MAMTDRHERTIESRTIESRTIESRTIKSGRAEGGSVSLWMDTADAFELPPLSEHLHTHTCIVGAGIAGLTTAYRLAKLGTAVVVLDEHGLYGGQTARTTGHLCNALDDRYFRLEELHGVEHARLAAQSHTIAVDTIESICRLEAIDCGFLRVDGYLVQGHGDERAGVLDREYHAALRAGLDCERVPGAPGALAVFGDALRFRNQAQFHGLRYLDGLARAVMRWGGHLYRARVHTVDGDDDTGVTTDRGLRINCDKVVVATHVPFNDRLILHTKQAAYRTYVIAARIDDGAVPPALLWDTLDPYHYVRVAREHGATWLIVGGEDRKVGQDEAPEAHFVELERWTREYFPMANGVDYRWSGQIIEPIDSLAFIGRNPGRTRNVYIATGDSGNGLTHGTIAGLLLADQITGRESAWTELYAPERKTLRAADEFLKENLNFVPFYGERLSGGDIDSPAHLGVGEAAIVREGLHKIAAWRDEDGTLHLHSAVCPHLGCVVHWNAAECSWDCPCHGSRFDPRDGSRLNGPADRGLAPATFARRPGRHDIRPPIHL
jgi:glycine/D-amino acid oxidase-like deaminating enzyme/nitrite reductase/ring-hydroxylating ferredoxin subunit